MEYRYLGKSGLQVPQLSFGAGTFGGQGPLFGHWGTSGVKEASRLVDICLDAGVTLFDTADVYSNGASEEVLGQSIKGKRDALMISTKMTLPMGDGANQYGSSRLRLIKGVEESLTRLGTDYIDLFQLHAFDAFTPIEEVLSTLDQLVRDGKIRYVGVSNFSGWQVMKSLAVSEKYGWPKYVAQQVYYSLIGRDYEADLMPLAKDQGLGALVWSPLGWGRLTGKIKRDKPLPAGSRLHETASFGPVVNNDVLFRVLDVLCAISQETGKSVPQIALNWLLSRPTVASIIIGARNESQLVDNLGAVGWSLSGEHLALLDNVSAVELPYPHSPYQRQEGFSRLNPLPV